MPRRRTLAAALLLAAVAGLSLAPSRSAVAAGPAGGLTDRELASLLKEVRPKPGEDVFATIPWQTSLWDARVKAAAEGKPILLWEMDGHPLGCG